MVDSTFSKSFPRALQRGLREPLWWAAIASLGAHAFLWVILPFFPEPQRETEVDVQQPVGLVQLTPEEESRLPEFTTPDLGLPPLDSNVPPLPDNVLPGGLSLSPLPNQPPFNFPLQPVPGLPPAPPPFSFRDIPIPRSFPSAPIAIRPTTRPRTTPTPPPRPGSTPTITPTVTQTTAPVETDPTETAPTDNPIPTEPSTQAPSEPELSGEQLQAAIARAESLTITVPFPQEACTARPADLNAPQLFVFTDSEGKPLADPPPILYQTSGNAILDEAATIAVQNYEFNVEESVEERRESKSYRTTVDFQNREEICRPRSTPRRNDPPIPNRDR